MNRPQRYLFRRLTIATLYAALGLTVTIWLSQSLRLIEMVVESGAPVVAFFQLLALTVPTVMGIVLPVALSGGTLFVYNRMFIESELVVMRSAGMGPAALALPALALSLVAGAIVGGLNLYVTPAARAALVMLERSVRNDYTQVLVRPGIFNEVGDGMTIYARERAPDGALSRIVIHDARDKTRPKTTMGERAVVLAETSGIKIVVFNGYQQELNRTDGRMSQLSFDRYSVDYRFAASEGGERPADARERSTLELFDPSDEVRADERLYRQFVSELNGRLSSPLLAPAYALIAVAALLFGEFNRRGQSVRVGIAAAFTVAVQAGYLGATGLSTKSLSAVPLLYLLPAAVIAAGLMILARGLAPKERRSPFRPAVR